VTNDLVAVPRAGRQLSDGLVVEASVIARLFGIRLLAIDIGLVVSPADVKRHRRSGGGAVGPLPRPMPITPILPSRPLGPGLAAAERYVDEGAANLAAVHSTATSPARG